MSQGCVCACACIFGHLQCKCMYLWVLCACMGCVGGFSACICVCMCCVCIYTSACMSGFAYVHMCGRVLCNCGGAFCGFVPVCVCVRSVSVFSVCICVSACSCRFVCAYAGVRSV